MFDDKDLMEVTLGKRGNGESKTLQAAYGEIHPEVRKRIFRYGFQRFVNDYVGGSDTTHDEKVKAAQERIKQMKDNTLPTRGSGGQSVDPITREIRNVLGAILRANKPEAWKKVKEAEDKGAALDAIFDKQKPDAQKALRAKAEQEVARKQAERKQVAALTVDV